MQRIIWIGGVACGAQIACIEDRGPTAESERDAHLIDAAPADVGAFDVGRTPDVGTPDVGTPDVSVTDLDVPDAAAPMDAEPPIPEPPQELPPWVCPPEGRVVFALGACMTVDGAVPESGRYEARISALGEGIPDGPCMLRDGEAPVIGSINGQHARWFRAVTPDGRVWQIMLDLPVEVRFQVGEIITFEAELEPGFFFGYGGHLAISSADGLKAFVQAGESGQPGLDDPELRLGVGEESCTSEEFSCVFTGRRLEAADPATDEVLSLSYGQIVDVGGFQVINGGIMTIEDQGACNASPIDFKIGAVRR